MRNVFLFKLCTCGVDFQFRNLYRVSTRVFQLSKADQNEARRLLTNHMLTCQRDVDKFRFACAFDTLTQNLY